MTSLGPTFFIFYDAGDGQRGDIRKDSDGNVFRTKESAERYAQEEGLKNPHVIDSLTFMNYAQRMLANRNR